MKCNSNVDFFEQSDWHEKFTPLSLYFNLIYTTHILQTSYFSEVSSEVLNELVDSSVGCAAGEDGFSGIREFVEVGFDEIVGRMVCDEDEEGVGVVEGVLGDELIIHAQQFSLAVPMPPSLEY